MAEAAALVGLLASLAQFVEYGVRLVDRLEDFSAATSDRPNAFTALRVRLPAVISIVSRIKKQVDSQILDDSEAQTLLPVLDNTNAHLKLLLGLIEKSAPKKSGSRVSKYVKALKSVAVDSEVQRISQRLHGNLQIISLFQTTSLLDATHRNAQDIQQGVPSYYASRAVATSASTFGTTGDDAGDQSITSGTRSRLQAPSISSTDQINIGLTLSDDLANDQSDAEPEQQHRLVRLNGKGDEDSTTDSIRCSTSCSCLCHRPYQLSTPSALVPLLGHLSVNYAGQAFVKVPCNEKKCRRRKDSAAKMTYRFPPWVLARVIHMAVSSSVLNTKVNLNTMRVLPDTAEVFSVISNGDLNRLRNMFKSGEASIYDISRSNWTLVHSAFTLGKRDISQFLIAEGADLTIDASNGSNVIERAWFLAQKSTKTPGDYVMCDNEVLREVDLDDFVSSQQYNLIHKIVLGITKLNLAQVLESSTADIDGGDIRGATALCWAASQGNVQACRTLLNHGADPKCRAALAQTPLHLARNEQTVRVLLQYDTEIDSRDGLGRTPLHCYCYRQVGASPLVVEEILKGGADVNALASGGQTALHYAAMFGNTDLIPTLLDHGASINAVKNDGLTSLMSAVRYDKAQPLRCLIDKGAEWRTLNEAGQNVLHLAALHGGVETLTVLATLPLESLDSNARDVDGRTPLDHFEGRRIRSEDLEIAFGELMRAAGGSGLETPTESAEGDGEELEEEGADARFMPGSFDFR
jgi:ankyrin repeat protein